MKRKRLLDEAHDWFGNADYALMHGNMYQHDWCERQGIRLLALALGIV